MQAWICERCGSNDFYEKDGYRVCRYCETKYKISPDSAATGSAKQAAESTIAIDEDVARLLEKCRREPAKARKYANLILDIDPSNREALKYL